MLSRRFQHQRKTTTLKSQLPESREPASSSSWGRCGALRYHHRRTGRGNRCNYQSGPLVNPRSRRDLARNPTTKRTPRRCFHAASPRFLPQSSKKTRTERTLEAPRKRGREETPRFSSRLRQQEDRRRRTHCVTMTHANDAAGLPQTEAQQVSFRLRPH